MSLSSTPYILLIVLLLYLYPQQTHIIADVRLVPPHPPINSRQNLDPGQVNFDKLSEVYLAQPEAAEEPVRRRLLRRVEKDDGNVIETIALVVNEDKAEAWGL